MVDGGEALSGQDRRAAEDVVGVLVGCSWGAARGAVLVGRCSWAGARRGTQVRWLCVRRVSLGGGRGSLHMSYTIVVRATQIKHRPAGDKGEGWGACRPAARPARRCPRPAPPRSALKPCRAPRRKICQRLFLISPVLQSVVAFCSVRNLCRLGHKCGWRGRAGRCVCVCVVSGDFPSPLCV